MAKRNKKGVTFVLSERSMRDPQSLDPEAPQHVPIPVNTNKTSADKSYEKFYGIEYDDDTDYLAFMKANPDEDETEQTGFMTKDQVQDMITGTKDLYGGYVDPEVAHMLEEENEDGEDRFEVVQTMAEIEKVGEEENNDLDDFVMNLKGNSDDEDEEPVVGDSNKDLSYSMLQFLGEDTMPQASSSTKRNVHQTIPEGEEVDDFDCDDDDDDFRELDRQTKFTEYSMSSSVMKRSEHLTQIDDTFEEFMEEFWDDDVGDMENQAEDIYNVSAETNEAATYRLMNMHNRQLQDNMPIHGDQLDPEEQEKATLTRKTIELMQAQKEVPDDYDPGLEVIRLMEEGREPKPQYDCESILSTKSNLYNRPKYVDESKTLLKNRIQLNKMGLPMGPGASFKQLKKAQKQMDKNNNDIGSDGEAGSGDNMSQMTSLTVLLSEASVRNKNESPAERKQRKQLVKELRKARREERKNTRIAFREEGIKQAKAEINRSRDTAIRL